MNSNLRIDADAVAVNEGRAGVRPVQLIGSAEQLGLVQKPETSLVLWQRHVPEEVHDWLGKLALLPAEDIRFTVKPEAFEEVFNPKLAHLKLPKGVGALWLIDDIAGLVNAFAKTTGASRVEVRLEWVSGDACWKFHRDYVTYRLVTTYWGLGTEWVPPQWSRQAIVDQQNYAGPLETLRAGEVAMFKGCRNNPEAGIVHRSPSMSRKGGTRLFLCLNVGKNQE